jgi:shikimate kinase
MGTGKSTVGPIVAEILGWAFVDADDEIENRAGMTIPEIFRTHGEKEFRQFESEVCRILAERSEQVVATGGGMLVDSGNRAIMQSTGLVICLYAQPNVIRERLGDGAGRPLAEGWESLYEQRREKYAAIQYQLDTSFRSPEEIAQEVVRLWQREST